MPERKVFNRYLTPAEESRLFRHIAQFRSDVLADRDYHWMLLLRHTGIRVSTLAALTVADAVDALSDPYRYLRLKDAYCKGGHGYKVKCNRKAQTALRGLLRAARLQGHAETRERPLVMSRQQGQGMAVRSFQQRMSKWVLSSGLPHKVSPHWFRHTLANRILKSTTHHDPLRVVQFALGHSDLQSTQIYTYPDREDIDRAMEDSQ